MIYLKRNIYFLNIAEIYFSKRLPNISNLKTNNIDFLNLIQSDFKFAASKPFYTCNIDLREDIEKIWQNINKNFRYEIRRAENKDKIFSNIICPSVNELNTFIKFFNKFAKYRSLRKANKKKLTTFLNKKQLKIAYAYSSKEKNILAGHCYINDNERIRLYHSASNVSLKLIDKNLVGRANKFLHWKTISKFKDLGFQKYDFGGISQKYNLNGIDKFKSSFHGELVTEHSGLIAISLKAKIIKYILNFISRG